MTLSSKDLFAALNINDTQHNGNKAQGLIYDTQHKQHLAK